MITFLPYGNFLTTFPYHVPDFEESLACLDMARLRSQRIEAYMILRCLSGEVLHRWRQTPMVRLWENDLDWLTRYYNESLTVFAERGGTNREMRYLEEKCHYPSRPPVWYGIKELHASHRANLLRKKPEYYSRFGWDEKPQKGYWWPK